MKLSTILIILVTGMLSCQKSKNKKVDKLLLVEIGQNLNYDSLDNPQIRIKTYIEFSDSTILKYASGDYYSDHDENAPAYNLDKFYTLEISDTIKQLINRTFANNSFDTSYLENGSGFYGMIYSLSDTIRYIVYHPESLPKDLFFLDSLFRSLRSSSKLIETKPYLADKSLPEFEKYLFKRLPPPSRPRAVIKFKNPKKY